MEVQLFTKRYIICPFSIDDTSAMFEMNNDLEVLKYAATQRCTLWKRKKDFLLKYYSRQKLGTGLMGIEDRSNVQLLGWIGFKYEE